VGVAITVYATANVSGGHLNPAVTFANCLTGHMSWGKGWLYVAMQLLGAIFGALIEVCTSSGRSDRPIFVCGAEKFENLGLGRATTVTTTSAGTGVESTQLTHPSPICAVCMDPGWGLPTPSRRASRIRIERILGWICDMCHVSQWSGGRWHNL
jgi:Major intrinsic protein